MYAPHLSLSAMIVPGCIVLWLCLATHRRGWVAILVCLFEPTGGGRRPKNIFLSTLTCRIYVKGKSSILIKCIYVDPKLSIQQTCCGSFTSGTVSRWILDLDSLFLIVESYQTGHYIMWQQICCETTQVVCHTLRAEEGNRGMLGSCLRRDNFA